MINQWSPRIGLGEMVSDRVGKGMLWEAYQYKKIGDAERAADRAEAKAERYNDDIHSIKRQVDRLSLACQAMWELLRDRSDLTEQDIESKILEIDGRDGRVDGKMGMQLLNCHQCGKATNSTRSICIMCGAPLSRPHQFEG